MATPPAELERLLRDLDRRLAEATDEAERAELLQLKERLSLPEMQELVRTSELSRFKRPAANPALEFHDPFLPTPITATATVIATTICLFAIVTGFENPIANILGTQLNLWVVAAFTGACSVSFTALSFMRTFSVHLNTEGMVSRVTGSRWRQLRVGAMRWSDIRSLHERTTDRVLEVRAANGAVLEIPMRVINYPILQDHLENMVRLFGDFSATPGS